MSTDPSALPHRVLDARSFDPDPLVQFRRWYAEIVARGVEEPDAMALATASPDGTPSARMVLLNRYDERGFVFFTNYRSRKGGELAANPRAALVLHWPALDRQVRIEGAVERLDPGESDAYFDERPIGSRLSAIASPQSQVVASRAELERRVQELTARYRHGGRIPRPDHWGGFRVVPALIEFWQSAPHRLNDRLRYRRQDQGWVLERLAP
jgi:pyridoxamine 5'-phosphate oxidase